MAVTPGALSAVSVQSNSASVLSAAATAGTGPYTYQWYMSTQTGFTPGAGNIVSGATALALTVTGLNASTPYYFKVVVTDTGDSNATAISNQLAIVTSYQVQNPNQFQQSQVLGQIDLNNGSNNIISVQVDDTQVDPILAGQAVKIVDSAGGVPKVIAAAADTDGVLGFVVYNVKNKRFIAGDFMEIAMAGTCIYLQATEAIARGAQVVSDVSSLGGVAQSSGSGGENKVGWAVDKAGNANYLIRVMLTTPSFQFDA